MLTNLFQAFGRKIQRVIPDRKLIHTLSDQVARTQLAIDRVTSRLEQMEGAIVDTRAHVVAARKEGETRLAETKVLVAELDRSISAISRLVNDLNRASCQAAEIEQNRQITAHAALVNELDELRREIAIRSALLRNAPRTNNTQQPNPPPVNTYILTAYDFNHTQRNVPVDPRLLRDPKNQTFYFFDESGIPEGFDAPALAEADIRPDLLEVGRKHLAEWTFFLAEYENSFLRYPFVAVSSRFYEKNHRLAGNLEMYLPQFGDYLNQYGYGYLPSYDRHFDFVDLRLYHQQRLLATRSEAYDLIEEVYGVRMPEVYSHTADYWCNYIGFRSRADLVNYVEFYLPVIRRFFDAQYRPTAEYTGNVVDNINVFRNEKPFTLLLELISHLYFYKNQLPYCGLHYDGFYEVSEHTRSFRRLLSFH